MRRFILFQVCVCLLMSGFAQSVSEDEAKTVARNFYFQRSSSDIPIDQIKVDNIFFIGNQSIYAINISQGGFLFISANKCAKPVLGYSFEGSFTPSTIHPALNSWINRYGEQIRLIRERNILPTTEIESEWNELSKIQVNPSKSKGFKSVSPLVKSKWNQGLYYNLMCPSDTLGPDGYALTGCVATTMGQLMYYWKFPAHGSGYYSYDHQVYGTISADFENTWYKWNEMADEFLTYNPEGALLIHHAGVAVDMRYGPNSSGMYNHKAAYALRTNFRYSPQTQYVFRDSTQLNWDSLLVYNLDRKMPLYYAGWESPSTVNIHGHAFVCDGYQGDYYHFNWGWGGAYDGYFYTNNLVPGGGTGFNFGQEMITNIFPDTLNNIYPSVCISDTLKSISGTFDDGSGPVFPYRNNSDCSWLIAPDVDSVTYITLTFDRINLQAGHDSLLIYKGNSSQSQLIASYIGDTLPTQLQIDNKEVFVRFISDNDSVSDGFRISYHVQLPVYCSSLKLLTATNGSFTDGSGPKYYNNNTKCKWLINPDNSDAIYLTFTFLQTELNHDEIIIRDSYMLPEVELYRFSGSTLPSVLIINRNEVSVEFRSDYKNQDQGFAINYSGVIAGINSLRSVSELLLYPNPVKDILSIHLNKVLSGDINYQLYTISGQRILSGSWNNLTGKQDISLDLRALECGFYLLELRDMSGISRFKILKD